MNRVGIIVTALVSLAAGLSLWHWATNLHETRSVSLEQMRPYRSLDGEFTVNFPSAPQNIKDTLPDAGSSLFRHYDTYISQNAKGTLFVVNVVEIPSITDGMEKKMEQVMDEMVALDPSNEMIEESKESYEGNPSMHNVVKNQSRIIESKAIVKGDKLYILSVTNPIEHFESDEFDAFVESFKITPGEKNE